MLYTDDVEGDVRRLESRGLVFAEPDGPGCPTFCDPDGHWFRLTDPG